MRSLPNKVEEYVFVRFNVLQKTRSGLAFHLGQILKSASSGI